MYTVRGGEREKEERLCCQFASKRKRKHLRGGEDELKDCRMCGRRISKKKKLQALFSHLGIMS